MRTNIGKIDRLARILLGGALFLAFLKGAVAGPLAVIALIICAVMILTAIIGTCPLYSAAKWSTIPNRTNNRNRK